MAMPEEEKHWLEPPEWWKKVKPLRWLAIGGIGFVLFSVFWTAKVMIAPSAHAETAKFTAMVPDPVAFLDGMKSYDSVATVSARLEAAKMPAKASSQRPRKSPKYPPRDRDTLVIDQYQHLQSQGQLTLEFFNDRLYEATFIPADPIEYAERLHAADRRLQKDRNGRAERVIGPLRIASNVAFAATEVGRNLNTRAFVVWQDLRLVELLDEWDRRFIALPAS